MSVWDAVSIILGVVIGGGIFLVPPIVARSLPAAGPMLLLWLCCAVLSFFGALAYAELGAMMPATGGQYVYLREMYGPGCAFLCGWTLFLIILPAQIAALAVGFATYLGQFVTLGAVGSGLVSLAVIAIPSAVNYLGAKPGMLLQKVLIAVKMAGLVGLALAALFAPPAAPAAAPSAAITFSQIGPALAACLLAYDGWNLVSFIGGEVRNAQRNVPLALAAGLGIIAGLYLLMNVAMLHVLSVPEIAGAQRVGSLLAERAFGPVGAMVLSVLILISIASSINGGAAAAPRAYFAQARDGLFFSAFGRIHPRFRTPSFSIAAQGVISALLAVTGSYELLITYAVFSGWVFYLLAVWGLILLRRTQPDRPRPYRMWGYPFTPGAFLAAAVFFLGNSLISAPGTSLVALGLIALGIPAYLLWRRNFQAAAVAAKSN